MKLSIITVCYNNKNGLIKTIDNVRNQTFKDYEFIIIDGGSKDGSKEIIEANKELFSFWCSEPDGGIYQGMNKGIDHAIGEYCLFLNSGDWLAHKDVLKKVFEKGYNEDILYGDVLKVRGRKKRLLTYSEHLTFKDFYNVTPPIHHQAAFIKRILFENYGKYREDTYLNADWHFFFKTVVQNNVSRKHLNHVISVCDATGASQTYSLSNPRVQMDLKSKEEMIDATIPHLSKSDYDKMCRISRLGKIKIAVMWRLSVLIPLKWMIALCK
jgi:glycosyltransferase involved in cell wall biosynthesis